MVTINADRAEFKFFRPDADRVFLVGDFNDWELGGMPMKRTADGHWVAHLALPPGEFKFRYFADGQWFTDYAAFGVEPGPHGLDSLLRVPKRVVRIEQAAERQTAAVAAA